MTRGLVSLTACALALIAGCSNPSTAPGTDTGTGGNDTGTGAVDTGVPPVDTGVPPMDTGSPPTDTGATADDTGASGDDAGTDAASASDANLDTNPFYPDGAIMCLPGVECTNWAAAIASADRGAAGGTVDAARANCVVQLHRTDCCGAARAYGVNHGSRTQLCMAESTCRSMYPSSPGCTSATIVTDTGETTTDASLVRVRAVRPTSCTFGTCYDCETFLCTEASCAGFGGITAGQCGP